MHIIFTYNFLKRSNGCKFAFNGQVKDDEIYGEGDVYDLGFREYDSRIGRMFSIDPRSFEYPWQTTYAYHRNSPISMIDYLGGGDPEDTKSTSNNNSTTYKIKAGDTFSALEKKWGLKQGTLTKMNSNLNPRKLQIGQEINKPSQNSSGVSENIIIPPIKSQAPIQDNIKSTPKLPISKYSKSNNNNDNNGVEEAAGVINTYVNNIYPNVFSQTLENSLNIKAAYKVYTDKELDKAIELALDLGLSTYSAGIKTFGAIANSNYMQNNVAYLYKQEGNRLMNIYYLGGNEDYYNKAMEQYSKAEEIMITLRRK